jgi:hypothetical protein
MNLRYRRFHPRDIPACVRLMGPYVEYSPDALSDLPTFWRQLYHDQAMIAAVETYGANVDARVVGFGADVFVADHYYGGYTRCARTVCERAFNSPRIARWPDAYPASKANRASKCNNRDEHHHYACSSLQNQSRSD